MKCCMSVFFVIESRDNFFIDLTEITVNIAGLYT